MPNMKAITRITGHNKKLLKKKNSPQSKSCNCKNKRHLHTKTTLPKAIYHLSSGHILWKYNRKLHRLQ